jgi:hypothetical protein
MFILIQAIFKQLKTNFLLFLSIYTLGLLFILLIFGASSYYKIPFANFSRDILAVLQAKDKLYIGLFSNIGGFLWAASFGVCLFSYFLWQYIQKDKSIAKFFLFGSLFSFILYADDIFLLHDAFFPSIHIQGKIFVLTYGSLLLIYLWAYIFLIVAFGFFALSLSADTKIMEKILEKGLFIKLSENTLYVIEDGSKFLGIISWFTYYSLCSLHLLIKASKKQTETASTAPKQAQENYLNY